MLIRQGNVKEMLSLWYKEYTSEFFKENIASGNAEFWTMESDGTLAGELYLFKNLDNKKFADGTERAYLCAFRIIEGSRGRGLGTALINRVFDRLGQLGFRCVTIGVEKDDEANGRLYQRLGFNEVIGLYKHDPCDVMEDYSPAPCPEFVLLKKTL